MREDDDQARAGSETVTSDHPNSVDQVLVFDLLMARRLIISVANRMHMPTNATLMIPVMTATMAAFCRQDGASGKPARA